MQTMGLTVPDRRKFEEALGGTAQLRVRASLQDLGGDEEADLSGHLLDGQVNLDLDAEVTRQATLTLDDPDHSLHLDSTAPAQGAMFADRMVGITYGVYVDDLAQWVNVPVFVGPVVSLSRDGDSVELSCLGKEHLSQGQCWRGLAFKKGANTLDTIRTILRTRGGETSFDFPTAGDLTKKRLKDGLSLSRMSVPWVEAQKLARSINAQLFYDGRGRCVLRGRGTADAWTFEDGDGGTVLTPPDVSFTLDGLVNAVYVKGGKPKGAQQAVRATAVAPRSHPLSPYRLGRTVRLGGKNVVVPRYLVAEEENDKLRSRKTANARAKQVLRQALEQGVDVQFDALPVPHLDLGDVVRLKTSEASIPFTFRKASLPLTHSGVMSVGHVRRVTPDRVAIRGRRW